MIVYKATNNDMTCTMGQGTFQYELGVPATVEKSKCGDTGLHACEYVLDCTGYYSLGRGNRFFKAAAVGDIAEDGTNTRIACTRLTLKKELDNRDIAREAMLYMLHHPQRNGWQKSGHMLCVAEQTADIKIPDGIAIARGSSPRVSGCIGAHLGLIAEQNGKIVAAKLFDVDGKNILPGIWYTLDTLAEAERRQQA